MKASNNRLTIILLLLVSFAAILSVPSSHGISICIRFCLAPGFTLGSTPAPVYLLPGQGASSSISESPYSGFHGAVNVTVTSAPSLTASLSDPTICTSTTGDSCGYTVVCFIMDGCHPICLLQPVCFPSSSRLTVTAPSTTPNGDYSVTLTGDQHNSTTNTDTTATVSIPVIILSPFAIVSSLPSLTPLSGASENSTITVESLYGFSGMVALTASVISSNSGGPAHLPAASFTPSAVTVPVGGNATSTLTMSPATVGNYSVAVTGTSGAYSSKLTMAGFASDFAINLSPYSSNLQAGSSYASTITLTSLNGFSGALRLSVTVKPGGTQNSFSDTTAVLSGGSKTSQTLTVYAPSAGTYMVNVTASIGTLSHSASLPLVLSAAPDFAASVPTSMSFTSGTSNGATIALSGQNGFGGTLTLTTSISPASGLTVLCSPTSITIGSAPSSASCTFSSTTPGNYAVTFTETSGSISHSSTLAVTVTPSNSALDFLKSNAILFIIAAAAVGFVVPVLVTSRKRAKTSLSAT